MTCDKCRLVDVYQGAVRISVDLCPLHAAAGELLEACRQVWNEGGQVSKELLAQVYDAVAKAEGK